MASLWKSNFHLVQPNLYIWLCTKNGKPFSLCLFLWSIWFVRRDRVSIIQVLVTISQMLTKTSLSWQIKFSINAILRDFCQSPSTVINDFADNEWRKDSLWRYYEEFALFTWSCSITFQREIFVCHCQTIILFEWYPFNNIFCLVVYFLVSGDLGSANFLGSVDYI